MAAHNLGSARRISPRAAGDTARASAYRAVFERGSKWIDANLFNGEFYIATIAEGKELAL